jgi:hypothetical protein
VRLKLDPTINTSGPAMAPQVPYLTWTSAGVRKSYKSGKLFP